MTVKELIDALSECNQEMEIVVKFHDLAMEIANVDGFRFIDTFTPNVVSYPCIAIEIKNHLGALDKED